MSQPPIDAFWVKVFAATWFGVFFGCLRHAVRMSQVNVLVSFLAFYWLLESVAHVTLPYFVYDAAFLDKVPLLFPAAPATTDCPKLVQAMLAENPRLGGIPFSVLAMEASLTYIALQLPRWFQPRALMVLVVVVLLVGSNAMLEPIVSTTYDCAGNQTHIGVGLWRWFLPSSGGGFHLAQGNGMPLFNYMAWSLSPALLISVTLLVERFRERSGS
jgi:hypothetical protein